MATLIGVCVNFLSGDTYSLHEEDFPQLVRLFDYIELPAMTVATLSAPEYNHLLAHVQEQHVVCRVMTNLFPPSLQLFSPGFEADTLRQYLKALLPRCALLGCRQMVFGSGRARMRPDSMEKAEADRSMAQILRQTVLPMLRDHGIKLLLEPLNKNLSNYILTLRDGAQLCEMCGGEIGMVADSLHLMDLPETPEDIAAFANLICHVHLSEKSRNAPLPCPSSALTAFLSELRQAGYAGAMSFECHLNGPEQMYAARKGIEECWYQIDKGDKK